MKINQLNRGYTLYLTDHEFALLERILKDADMVRVWDDMPTGERRSYSRRMRGGYFLRVDKDRRGEREGFYANTRTDRESTE